MLDEAEAMRIEAEATAAHFHTVRTHLDAVFPDGPFVAGKRVSLRRGKKGRATSALIVELWRICARLDGRQPAQGWPDSRDQTRF